MVENKKTYKCLKLEASIQEDGRRSVQSRVQLATKKTSRRIDGSKMLTLVMSIGLALCSLAVIPAAANTPKAIKGEVSEIAGATHLEFQGKTTWNYDLAHQPEEMKFVLKIPALDSETLKQLEQWKSPLVKKIQVNTQAADGNHEIVFWTNNNNVKAFDYLTDEPSRLIIDFYTPVKKKSQKKKEVVVKKALQPKVSKAKKTKTKKLKVSRRPAGTDFIIVKNQKIIHSPDPKEMKHGIFDGADPQIERFRIKESEIDQAAIKDSEKNIYLRFPLLDRGFPYLKKIIDNPPEYEIRKRPNQENKIARLLIDLHKERKVASFDKTMKFFRAQYPDSMYNEIVDFLEADLHYYRWQQDKSLVEFENAMLKYRQIIERYPESPLIERTYMLMGYSYLKRKDALGTVKIFQRLLKKRPKTKFRDRAELATAKAFLQINRYKDAVKIYEKVAKKGIYQKNRIEAQYLVGDVFYKKGDFRQAIQRHELALQMYPEQWKNYPNSQFHLAESQFWLKNYKKSMNAFIEFLQKFPDQSYGGYAMTRLGELLEIFGASEKKILGAFLESYFRYKDTEGGALSRVRILTLGMKDMKEKELEAAQEELHEIMKRLPLKKADQFVTVKMSDGFHVRRDFAKATQVLLDYHSQNPTKTDLKVFGERVIRNITSTIKKKVEQGYFLSALKEYSRFSDSWLKNNERIDTRYYIGQSYEQAGVFRESEKLYKETLNELYSLRGRGAVKRRSRFEELPQIDSLNLRLATVLAKTKDFSQAHDYIKAISEPDKMSQEEQIELIELAAQISEERGQTGVAKNFLSKAIESWKGQPAMVSGPYLRLARLQIETGEDKKAANTLQKVVNLTQSTGQVPEEHQFQTLNLKGDLHLKLGQKEQAVDTYKEALKQFEEKKDLAGLRYKAGKILYDQGQYEQAQKVWQKLGEKENVWSSLASEQNSDFEWRDRYKKYLSRIPAMENFKNKSSKN